MQKLSYGQAIEAVKDGKLIARQGWNGKGMFVFMRPADELTVDFIVHNVKSLPTSVKKYFVEVSNPVHDNGILGGSKIEFKPYLCLKTPNHSIVNGWVSSQEDVLATDWSVLDF
jgi:Protein of unknown function (DUF2829)